MADKYIALAEETVFRTATGSGLQYLKLLNESISTTREDFYPETTQSWVVQKRAEGIFRTSGNFATLVDPMVWGELLVFFMGDATSSGPNGDGQYTHTFPYFGDTETVTADEIKPVTVYIGTGIERDRQIEGCVINSLSLEATARNVVSSTVGIIGSGDEELIAAKTPDWSAYTRPYLTFANVSTMTIGGTDRLTTQPVIENFRITFDRGFDEDYRVLGNRFWANAELSGMATSNGSMDFSFKSQDEHERFLQDVGSYNAGDNPIAGWEIVLKLQSQAVIGGSSYRMLELTLPKVFYTASNPPVNARDRIIQSVDFTAMHDGTNGSGQFVLRNETATYT
jgi:hypothetical protein